MEEWISKRDVIVEFWREELRKSWELYIGPKIQKQKSEVTQKTNGEEVDLSADQWEADQKNIEQSWRSADKWEAGAGPVPAVPVDEHCPVVKEFRKEFSK